MYLISFSLLDIFLNGIAYATIPMIMKSSYLYDFNFLSRIKVSAIWWCLLLYIHVALKCVFLLFKLQTLDYVPGLNLNWFFSKTTFSVGKPSFFPSPFPFVTSPNKFIAL